MNNFNQLNAQDDMSALAKMTPEEIAEANNYYDDIMANQDNFDDCGPTLNAQNWSLLFAIHVEIAPLLTTMHCQEDILENIGV